MTKGRTVDEETEAASLASSGAEGSALALVVHDGSETRLRHVRAGERLVLGRDADADVTLNDRQVSRRHARIVVRPGAVVVEDLGSRNGTRVDGHVLHGSRRTVNAGSTIGIGTCWIVVAAEPITAKGDTGEGADAERVASPGIADAAMLRVYADAGRVAPSAATVLVIGETGVGKDMLARQIHAWSGRSGPFVRINCATIPESLLESELFGHEKGAFTGASERRLGVFEQASAGTLFIDEIGDMPLAAQLKLLNVLESRSFRRLGGSAEIASTARIVCATHRDLAEGIAEGTFRADLYYRIGAFVIAIPPLRERPADLVVLARHVARDLASLEGRPDPVFAPGVMESLLAYEWPGNVRELRNALERALVLSQDGVLKLEDFPPSIRSGAGAASRGQLRFRDRLHDLERKSILDALTAEEGNRTRAAQRLGMPRRTLVAKLAQYKATAGDEAEIAAPARGYRAGSTGPHPVSRPPGSKQRG